MNFNLLFKLKNLKVKKKIWEDNAQKVNQGKKNKIIKI